MLIKRNLAKIIIFAVLALLAGGISYAASGVPLVNKLSVICPGYREGLAPQDCRDCHSKSESVKVLQQPTSLLIEELTGQLDSNLVLQSVINSGNTTYAVNFGKSVPYSGPMVTTGWTELRYPSVVHLGETFDVIITTYGIPAFGFAHFWAEGMTDSMSYDISEGRYVKTVSHSFSSTGNKTISAEFTSGVPNDYFTNAQGYSYYRWNYYQSNPTSKILVIDPYICDIGVSLSSVYDNGASATIINPSSGGQITFNGSVSPNTGGDSWAFTIYNQADNTLVQSATGSLASVLNYKWNGKNTMGGVVAPGYYIATLSASIGTNCSAVKTLEIEVTADASCNLLNSFGSTVNVASGNLSHSQELFSVRGGPLPTAFELTYNSLANNTFPLGRGWTHSYNSSLETVGADALNLIDKYGEQTVLVFNTTDNNFYPMTTVYPYIEHKNLGILGGEWFYLHEKDGSILTYSMEGKLQLIADKNGNTVNLIYGAGGRLDNVIDPGGRTTQLFYDENGRINSISAPDDRIYTLEYDPSFHDSLQRVLLPGDSAWAYVYDPVWGRMQTRTDPANHTTTYDYDDQGRASYSLDFEGGEKRIAYNSDSALATVTEKDNGIWYWWYDSLAGTLIAKQNPDGDTQYNYYDEYRNLITSIDHEDGRTEYTYDSLGDVLTSMDPLGNTTTYTYDNFGRMTSMTTPSGDNTVFVYDPKGNLTDTISPNGATTHQEVDAQGKIRWTTDPQGRRTDYSYDAIGNVASITDNVTGNTTSFIYNNNGDFTQQIDANGVVTKYDYDNNARLKTVISDYGYGHLNIKTSYEYDAMGNRTKQTDANGNVTQYEYDSKGHLTKIIDAFGGTTINTFGGNGCSSCGGGTDLLTAVTDQVGRTTRFEYDLLGHRTKMIDPSGAWTTYSYDARGNLATATDNNGHTTQYFYDASSRQYAQVDARGGLTWFDYTQNGQTDNVIDANRKLTHYAYDNTGKRIVTSSPDTGTTTSTYNLDGTLHSRTDANGTMIVYDYDNSARLTDILFPDSTQNITFTYDSPTSSYGKGRLTGMTDPSGVTTYQYDALGQIVQEAKNVLGVIYTTSYAYDNVGNPSTITYPSGRTVSYGYNALNRVTSVTATLNGIQSIIAQTFLFDNGVDLRSFLLGNGITQSWSYDNNGRTSTIDAPGVLGYSYEYDPVGNIVTLTDRLRSSPILPPDTNTTTYAYQANRLMSVTDAGVPSQYGYDNVGNTITAGARTLIYNQNKRLIQLFDQGVLKGQYSYDGKGRRVTKIAGSATTVYHYDLADRLISETDEQGHLLVDYVYLEGKPLAQIRKPYSTEAVYYYHLDHLATPKAMTDAAKNVVWQLDTDPFGVVTGTPLVTVTNNLRFPGQYYDSESGLRYNFHRDYDPKTGRYVEADPIGLAGGMNLYSYVRNNPISLIDALGLWSTDAHNSILDEFGRQLGISSDLIAEMKRGSADADSIIKYQGDSYQYMHAMSSSALSKKQSCVALKSFVLSYIINADTAKKDLGNNKLAYYDYGFGLHAIMDATSPVHAGFQLWEWKNAIYHGASPWSKEDVDSISKDNLELTVNLMRAAIGGDININCACYE